MPAETPSPSPLSPEEREAVRYQAYQIRASSEGRPRLSEADIARGFWSEQAERLLAECDRLAARVSDLEAARLRDAEVSAGSIGALAVTIKHLRDEALDVAECRRLANVAVDQAEAARAKLRSVMAERDGLRALCDRVREALGRIDSAHDALPVGLPSRSETVAWSEAYNRAFADMRAAIEALGPGGPP